MNFVHEILSQDAAKQVWFCSLDTLVQLYTKPKRVVNLQVGKAACAVQIVDTRQRGAEVIACLYCQAPRQRPIKMACKNCVEVFILLRQSE